MSPTKDKAIVHASIGPGYYEETNTIVNKLGEMTIGEKRTETQTRSIGPGHYEPILGLTKSRSTTAVISPSRNRKREIRSPVGPGTYEENNNLAAKLGGWTIGEKRAKEI